MSSYHDFRRRSLKRRMRQKVINIILIALAVLALCGIAWYALYSMGVFAQDESTSSSTAQSESDSAATETQAPEGDEPVVEISNQTSIATPNEKDANWNTVDYDIRVLDYEIKYNGDGTTAMDYRLAGLEENGLVDISYFDGTAFLGDSISQGFSVYDTDITDVGATFCTYQNISPKGVVDLSTWSNAYGVEEIPLDALTESAPDQIYILLGTNTLTTNTDYSSFLAYYDVMIDMIYERLPDVTIYIQSVTPVTASVVSSKSGLYTARLMEINDELAALALRKGCYFLNLWEVLADEDGNFKSEYAAADGIHMNTSGYQVWIDYLRSHTAYTPDASYAAGTSYKIEE
ncbi:MAG: GDSL-type esterase/lipase family protein [Faecalibacterium sp.]